MLLKLLPEPARRVAVPVDRLNDVSASSPAGIEGVEGIENTLDSAFSIDSKLAGVLLDQAE